MELPPVPADGHLHDFRRAFVNRGDAYVAADFLHEIFVRVTVTSKRLDTGISSLIPCFGRHVLRNGTFRIQGSFSRINALRSLFYEGTRSLQSRDVRHDQFVRITLLFGEWRSRLNPLG